MGLHALTVGAIGGMIMGMITRTARGHTGRPLTASNAETCAYVLVMMAPAVRVAAPAMPVQVYAGALLVAGILWVCAFTLYLVRFSPWLMSPRADGKDG